MGRRTDIPWLAIRSAFLQGESIHNCAIRFNVSETQIYRKANVENWRAQLQDKVRDARSRLDDLVLDKRTARLQRHVDLLEKGYAAVERALAECSENTALSGRNLTEATRAATDAMQKWLLASRAVEGVQQDAPSVPEGRDEEDGVRYVRTIDPRREATTGSETAAADT